ncbi:PIH1 domain-containing protein 2 isoform X1 [Entelurus aequoreus]|uniref:PIH1 domain-containing protein 2 isoform X1 n=1 Tax=Entelurus aequoreus TaxID=161455 RepID=UPI002B1CFF5A|nr:PIH1 domain-containing protein 2 isoform X1 [Entelurus aequoreus]XP_061915918.1 PIH1 domain-containing protein 2 isoform X1 [Entelurus aequoreus]
MSSGRSGDVVEQVSRLWSMLDDLCLTDPEAYRSFVEKQVTSGLDYNTPPRVESCIRTDVVEPRGLLYINICSWKRVPAPQDPSEPLPVYAGSLEADTNIAIDGATENFTTIIGAVGSPETEEVNPTTGGPTVLDIAFNPEVLQKCKKDKEEMDQVYLLALRFVQKQHGLKLSQRYIIVSFSPRNGPEDLHRRLGFQQQRVNTDKQSDTATQSPESLLQQISSLRAHKEDTELPADIVRGPAVRKKGLIEVISSTTFQRPEKPECRLEVKAHTEGFPCKLELTVELPKINSMSEWQLKMSKDDVLLEVEDVYYLLLDFPKAVNENSAVAIFNKKSRRLTVTADIL